MASGLPAGPPEAGVQVPRALLGAVHGCDGVPGLGIQSRGLGTQGPDTPLATRSAARQWLPAALALLPSPPALREQTHPPPEAPGCDDGQRLCASSSGQRRGGVHAAGQSSGRKGHQGWALPVLSTSREPAAPPELCGDPGDPDLSYLAGGLWAAGLGEALMPELGSPLPPSGSANPHLARAGEQGQKKKLLKKHAAALPGTRRGRRRPALEGAPRVQEAPFPR